MRRESLLTALALAAGTTTFAACKRDRDRAPAADPAAADPAKLPPPLAGTDFYRVDIGPQTPCTAGAPCELRLVLTALGSFHVNKDYPFKFVGEPAAGLAVEGTGTFALDDAKTGTLTIRYRAAKSGRARFTGQFKLSVCNDERCEIEQPKIELEVPVG
jgi:hypothetical protein